MHKHTHTNTHTHTHTPAPRALEKRLSQLVSECEAEADQRKVRDSKVLELEKELTMVKIERKEVGRKLEEAEETNRTV